MSDTIANFRYQLYEIDAMVRAIERPAQFLTTNFFGATKFSTTPTIEWDIVEGGRRLAPFVHPTSQGQAMKKRGAAQATISPAYIKPLDIVTPQQAFTRTPGEQYGGSKSLQQRIDEAVSETIVEHRDMIDNRLEWMAAKILGTGGVTISGDDYPSQTVDFGQSSTLRVDNSGADDWDETTADPLQDLEDLALAIRTKSFGAIVTDVVMEGQAWAFFKARVKDNKIFDSTIRISNGDTRIDATPRVGIDAELMGRVGGKFNIWVYDAAYESEAGVATKFLTDYHALVVSRGGIEGTQYYGAIQDLDAMLPLKHFVKTWKNENPSGMNVLSQSAPVLGPRRRNAFGRILTKGS